MQSMTLEQLRAANQAGGVRGVTLRALGGAFLVEIATRSGSAALLAKARSEEPRRFGNPAVALTVLRDVGITVGRFDATEWDPNEKVQVAGNRGRAEAMREAHRAAAYNHWLLAEIQSSIDDSRPSIPHEDVMREMEGEIAALRAAKRRGKRGKGNA